jgi:malonyl CoA-acyl carrier protein transacylase
MEQAEALYKRARKLRRAVDAVQPLLEAAQQEAEYLETVRVATCCCLC